MEKKELLLSRGWCHLPKIVLFDPELTDKEKLLFAFITSYMAQEGYCWMSNNFLADQFGVSREWVSGCIKKLKDLEYFTAEYIRESGKKEIKERHLYLGMGIKNAIKRCKITKEGSNLSINRWQSLDEEVVIPRLRGSNREFKENKNNKNKNNRIRKDPPLSENAKTLTNQFYTHLKRSMPNIKLQSNFKDKWADSFDKMLRLDKRSFEEITKIVDHCFNKEKSWWAQREVIRTPCKFRKFSDKGDGPTYYDLIKREMEKNGQKAESVPEIVNIEDM